MATYGSEGNSIGIPRVFPHLAELVLQFRILWEPSAGSGHGPFSVSKRLIWAWPWTCHLIGYSWCHALHHAALVGDHKLDARPEAYQPWHPLKPRWPEPCNGCRAWRGPDHSSYGKDMENPWKLMKICEDDMTSQPPSFFLFKSNLQINHDESPSTSPLQVLYNKFVVPPKRPEDRHALVPAAVVTELLPRWCRIKLTAGTRDWMPRWSKSQEVAVLLQFAIFSTWHGLSQIWDLSYWFVIVCQGSCSSQRISSNYYLRTWPETKPGTWRSGGFSASPPWTAKRFWGKDPPSQRQQQQQLQTWTHQPNNEINEFPSRSEPLARQRLRLNCCDANVCNFQHFLAGVTVWGPRHFFLWCAIRSASAAMVSCNHPK